MNLNESYALIDILGKSYQIKCTKEELPSLQESALYLENKMKSIHASTKGVGIEKVAVIAALNIVHDFLHIEEIVSARTHHVQKKLAELHLKIINALAENREELETVG